MTPHDEPLFKETTTRDKPGLRTAFKTWLLRHVQVFFYSLGQLWRAPLSMLMTAAVIGIALALPTGLHVLLKNTQQLSAGWDGGAKLSVFLQTTTSQEQAVKLHSELQRLPQIAQVQFISREQAMAEFKQHSGYGEAVTALGYNPLPYTLVITPAAPYHQPAALEQLVQILRAYPSVDVVQLDQQWVKRLFAIMQIISRGIDVLGSMLALAVILIVGNTIRLAIQNRREEIVVIKLIGGTDAFIRRPFLYTGFWYGLAGGILAILMVYSALWLLAGPVEHLAGLYQTPLRLQTLGATTMAMLLAISISLGLLGSWLAVGRHLREIEPR